MKVSSVTVIAKSEKIKMKNSSLQKNLIFFKSSILDSPTDFSKNLFTLTHFLEILFPTPLSERGKETMLSLSKFIVLMEFKYCYGTEV